MNFIFIIPTDELIFFRGVGTPPTSWVFCRKITSQPEDDRLPKIGLEPEAKWWRSRCSALLCWKLGTWNAEFLGPEKVGKDRDLWSKNGDLPSKSQVTRWQKHSKSDLTDSTPILEVQTIFLSVKITWFASTGDFTSKKLDPANMQNSPPEIYHSEGFNQQTLGF